MKRIFLIICLAFLFSFVNGINIDSLLNSMAQLPEIEKIKKLNDTAYYFSKTDPTISKKIAIKAYDLAIISKNRKGVGKALGNIGFSFFYTYKFENAIEYLDSAYQIYSEIDDKYLMGKTAKNSSMACFFLAEYSKALMYLEKAEKHFKDCKSDEILPAVYMDFGMIKFKQGDFEEALLYYFRCNEYEIEDNKKIKLNNRIGTTYWAMGDYDKAVEYLYNSLEISEKLEYKKGISIALNNIANIFMEWGNMDEALKYHYKGLELSREMSDSMQITSDLNNIADIYSIQTNYDTALIFYNEGLLIAETINDYIKVATIRHNMASIFALRGQDSLALKNYFDIYVISRKIGDKRMIAIALSNIAAQHQEMGKVNEAKDYFQKAIELSKDIQLLDNLKQSYKKLSVLEEYLGNFESALQNYKKYDILTDSLFNAEKLNIITDIQTKYETEKKKKEILQLKSKTQKQKTFQNYLYIVISSLFLITILLVFYFRQIRKNLKQKRLFAEKETENLKNKLDFRNKELATNAIHLVNLNNLSQTIIEKTKECLLHTNKTGKEKLNEIIREIEFNIHQDAWNEFETRFEKVHNDFFINLDKKHSGLTPTEIKTCAFLRLNMSSKDIAALTNKSVRTVEKLRTNIRKKMELSTETNLVNYLMKF
ncbi:MAG: tetratricopeptide repeat protein [Bacteroidetes bacterium]|jgi:tetratricopeptide (TPR) repeat protein/DNA-binding CsgD family transcriptional regulator|nr:tetratricopeptide repeat protein [Bacteroidota bacterium]MBT6686966.1 tetratricopeptide repeat protein [Bacteroidota bacterium]MBT7143020.1 tetratricopeptide repeat protein [Bacteroidota bacterium]MBT7493077.1 tetratricopeptide repeat protein [Bacteroidota bacterium]